MSDFYILLKFKSTMLDFFFFFFFLQRARITCIILTRRTQVVSGVGCCGGWQDEAWRSGVCRTPGWGDLPR